MHRLEPTDRDIKEMLKWIGVEIKELKISPDNQARLFRGILELEHVKEVYDDLIQHGTAKPGPMWAALQKFVARSKQNYGHLSAVATKWAEQRGIERGVEAQLLIVKFLQDAEDVAQISRTLANEPKARDERHTGSRRTRAVNDGILKLLKEIDVEVSQHAGAYKGRESGGLKLAAAIASYLKRKKLKEKLEPSSFARRRHRQAHAPRGQFRNK
jgi:hypothetical protein